MLVNVMNVIKYVTDISEDGFEWDICTSYFITYSVNYVVMRFILASCCFVGISFQSCFLSLSLPPQQVLSHHVFSFTRMPMTQVRFAMSE